MLTPSSLVDPRRGAGTGAAVIFRGDNRGILSNYTNLQRLQALRAKAEADRKAKEDAERFKQMQVGLKIDDDTAPIYQKPYSEMVSGAKQSVGSLYNASSPTYVADPFSRQSSVDTQLAPVRTYKRLADDDWTGVVKPAVAAARADAELRGDDIEKELYNAHYVGGDSQNGALIAPADLPRGYQEKILNDPRYINSATATDNFAKKLPGSQEYADLLKGKPGTYSESDELMTRFAAIRPDGKGGHEVKLDENGRPVLRNPLALLQAANGTRFGKLIDYDMQQQAAARESAVEKMRNNEQLTDAERAAVSAPPKTKLDFLTDRLLGHVVIKSKESRQYIPLPRPRVAAGTPGFTAAPSELIPGVTEFNIPAPDVEATVPGIVPGAPISPASRFVPDVAGAEVLGKSKVATNGPDVVNFDNLGYGNQPYEKDKYGRPTKEVAVKDAKFSGVYARNEKGQLQQVASNQIPLSGTLGRSFAHAIDTSTGKAAFGLSAQELKAGIASGRLKPMTFVELNTDKNANFANQYEANLQSRIEANDNSANPKSMADLEAAARNAVSKGRETRLIPMTPENAQALDARTNGYYRGAQRLHLQQSRGYRASVPAAPKRPTGTDLGTTKLAGSRKSGVAW